jgi:hypothetical protein
MTQAIVADDAHLISDLIYRHSAVFDERQSHVLADLYTPDGELDIFGRRVVGSRELTDWGVSRAAVADRRTRHVVTNVRLAPLPGGRVAGVSLLTLFAWSPEQPPAQLLPSLLAEYHDVFARPAGTWLFERRRVVKVWAPDLALSTPTERTDDVRPA